MTVIQFCVKYQGKVCKMFSVADIKTYVITRILYLQQLFIRIRLYLGKFLFSCSCIFMPDAWLTGQSCKWGFVLLDSLWLHLTVYFAFIGHRPGLLPVQFMVHNNEIRSIENTGFVIRVHICCNNV